MLLGQPGGGGGLSRGWKGTRQGRAPKGGGAPAVGRCVWLLGRCGCLEGGQQSRGRGGCKRVRRGMQSDGRLSLRVLSASNNWTPEVHPMAQQGRIRPGPVLLDVCPASSFALFSLPVCLIALFLFCLSLFSPPLPMGSLPPCWEQAGTRHLELLASPCLVYVSGSTLRQAFSTPLRTGAVDRFARP